MKARSLTETYLRKIKAPDKGRAEHYDTDVRGLALRVTNKDARSWIFTYRKPNGSVTRLKIGRYPEWTLKEARKAAREARIAIDRGADPLEDRNNERQASEEARRETYEKVVRDYIQKAQRGSKTAKEMARVLTVYPHKWAKTPVKEITKRHVEVLIDTVEEDRGVHQAAYLYRTLSAFFNWAYGRGKIESLPIHKTLRPKIASDIARRNRPLNDEQITAVWKAAEDMGYCYGRLVQLMLLTGQRRGEVSGMRWSEIDLNSREWRLPAERTKTGRGHTIPLNDLAVEILEDLPRFKDGDFVFTVNEGASDFRGFSRPRRILKEAAGVEFMLKDARATVATGMEALEVDQYVVSQCLNHSRRDVTGTNYAGKHNLRAKRRAFDAWGRHVEKLIGREVGNVVEFAQA